MSQLIDKADGFIKSHWALVTFAAVCMTFCVALIFGIHSYQAKLAKANTAYAVLQAKVSADDAAVKSHEVARVQQTAEVKSIDTKIQTRDNGVAALKAALTSAGKTDVQVQADAQTYLGVLPSIEPAGMVVQKKDVQQFIATKVDDTAAQQDNTDLKTQVVALTDEVSSSEADLKSCESDKDATNTVLLDYKKAATKSKWRKTLDVTEKVGLLGAGLYIGYKAAK